jgi:hypothetical protein
LSTEWELVAITSMGGQEKGPADHNSEKKGFSIALLQAGGLVFFRISSSKKKRKSNFFI